MELLCGRLERVHLLFYYIFNFIVYFSTSLLLHFILYADSYHILYRGMRRIVY